MPRLFYKIFLWFWLGIIAVSATLVAVTGMSRSRADDDRIWREQHAPRVDLVARQEVRILRRQGSAALEKYVRSIESDRGMRNYIFDDQGREVIAHRDTPAYIADVLRALGASAGDQGVQAFDAERVMGERIAGSDGRAFTVIVDYPQPSLLRLSLFDILFEDFETAQAVRLAGVLIVAACVCFWLARQLVRPIDQLRAAARQLASEHLETRVDPVLLARHDELADLGRDFDLMAQRIERLVSAHRHLLSEVSHSLRSPLARLNVALALARRDAPSSAEAHLNRIEAEAARVDALTGQLLMLARLDSGVDLERMTPFDLNQLLEEVAADGHYEAHARGCAVVLRAARPCLITGAREILRGTLENVVRNAARHTAAGTTVEIVLRVIGAGAHALAVVQVRDHGPGVPAQALDRLFTPFYQIAEAGRTSHEGSGLGLAITRRTVDLHGGTVRAVNAPDGGLLVTIEIPSTVMAPAETDDRHAPAPTRLRHNPLGWMLPKPDDSPERARHGIQVRT